MPHAAANRIPSRVAIDRARVPPGDAMSHRADPAELLDIEMDKLARVLALIAADRLGRLQRGEPIQPEPVQDAADGRRRYPDFGGDLLARVALPPQSLDNGTCGRWGLAWQ